jgi:hypothetical protein
MARRGIRALGKEEEGAHCLGSCIYIKFKGRGSGRESSGGYVLFKSVY